MVKDADKQVRDLTRHWFCQWTSDGPRWYPDGRDRRRLEQAAALLRDRSR